MFVLSTYPNAAESLIGNLRATGLDLPWPLEFTTQVVWKQGGGRPDILGKSGDDAFLIIEAKFDAPLTNSQPVDYLRCLPTNASGILLFLTPARRVEAIWGELDKRCRRARLLLGERAAYPNGLSAAPLPSGHRLAIASWESLLSYSMICPSRTIGMHTRYGVGRLDVFHRINGMDRRVRSSRESDETGAGTRWSRARRGRIIPARRLGRQCR